MHLQADDSADSAHSALQRYRAAGGSPVILTLSLSKGKDLIACSDRRNEILRLRRKDDRDDAGQTFLDAALATPNSESVGCATE
jgi:hypothetical protein